MMAAALIAMYLAPAAAWAQESGRLRGESQALLSWGTAAGIVIICCVAAFMNPKRSHLG